MEAGITVCFGEQGEVDEVCNIEDRIEAGIEPFAGYEELETELLRIADRIRGFEVDRLTGVDDHRSFYYEDK